MDYTSLSTTDYGVLGGLLGAAIGLIIFVCIIGLAMLILEIIGSWKTFKKAGKPGWAAIVPVYNIFVALEVAKLEWWHLLIIIGFGIAYNVNSDAVVALGSIGLIAYEFVIAIRISKAFGKTTGFGVFTAFFPYIGYMILGCGSAKYKK